MVVSSELEAVVAAADKISLAACVAVIDSAVKRSVTVSLAFITGILRSAASPSLVVPASAPLAWQQSNVSREIKSCQTWGRIYGDPGSDDWRRSLCGEALRQVTAVILGVIEQSKLPAVVAATHEISSAALVAVVLSAV